MDRGAWQATVHGVSRVGHDNHYHFHFLLNQPVGRPGILLFSSLCGLASFSKFSKLVAGIRAARCLCIHL